MLSMAQKNQKFIHWSDSTAERIIKQFGDREEYVLASGITPSGQVHFGNFREVITVDFVARALRDKGKRVRFIFSWDDYDTFRKVPINMPQQEELKGFLFHPIVDTPDPYGEQDSYAAHHEKVFEAQLKRVGISAQYIYQAEKYRAGDYRQQIRTALDKAAEIAEILNRHRANPLPSDWLPISVYCSNCNRDNAIEDKKWDGSKIAYHCKTCDFSGAEELDDTTRVKLPWRVDWPMRWAYEKVDFEPGGKDHSSQGGSFSTAKEIVKLFGWRTPAYLQYDFVGIKGGGGKMSSSSGAVVTLGDVLKIYSPTMVRWIFAGYKTNVDFSIAFDLDVIKTYEDYDRGERLAFGLEEGNEKKAAAAKRTFELSWVGEMPQRPPFRPPFRHLTNILQINDLDINKSKSYYREDLQYPADEESFLARAEAAVHWIENYAPQDFKFSLNTKPPGRLFDDREYGRDFLSALAHALKSEEELFSDSKLLHEKIYDLMREMDLDPKQVFPLTYQLLISKDKGPKLASFMQTIGRERLLQLLDLSLSL